jgi:hypothetical protein
VPSWTGDLEAFRTGKLDGEFPYVFAPVRVRLGPGALPPGGRVPRNVTGFTKILTGLRGDRLDRWLAAVDAYDQPDLHPFI